MVQLQFSSGKGISGQLIRFLTWSDIAHVDFLLDETTKHPGQLLGARPHGGVQIRKPDVGEFRFIKRATVDVPSQLVLALAASQIGKPYDYLSILNFARQRHWRNPQSWFCSDLVAWCFEKAGYPLLNVGAEVWRITPRDLLLSLMVKVQN